MNVNDIDYYNYSNNDYYSKTAIFRNKTYQYNSCRFSSAPIETVN